MPDVPDKTGKNAPARDENGRLLPGHAPLPGGGRPKGSGSAAYLEATRRQCSTEKWEAMVAVQVEKALGGDSKAFELVRGIVLPKPENNEPPSEKKNAGNPVFVTKEVLDAMLAVKKGPPDGG